MNNKSLRGYHCQGTGKELTTSKRTSRSLTNWKRQPVWRWQVK